MYDESAMGLAVACMLESLSDSVAMAVAAVNCYSGSVAYSGLAAVDD